MTTEAIVISDDLVSAARAGDSAAQSRLWDACTPILRAALRRHSGRPSTLEIADLAQEAAVLFLELLQAAPNVPSTAEPFAQRFARALYWRMRDYLRAERRRLGRQTGASDEDLERALARWATGAPPTTAGRRAVRALEQLSPRQRAVMSSLYLEDHSLRTVARDLGVSEGTVVVLRRRALVALRRALAEPTAAGEG